MAELGPEIVADVVAACEAGASEAGEALGRALDATSLELSVGEAGTFDPAALGEGYDAAGLAVMLKIGEVGAAFLIPETSGLLPDWYAAPDPTGESKLTTLAQELSMVLLPETFLCEEFKAAKVSHLGEALTRSEIAAGAPLVPLELKSEDKSAAAMLVWPMAKPEELFEASAAEEESEAPAEEAPAAEEPVAAVPSPAPAPPKAATPTASPSDAAPSNPSIQSMEELPQYMRSLLHIKVPVVATLARTKQSVEEITELGPGAILQFDKSCEEMLELHVGGRRIALGEAVKVGDKFGLRIKSVELPDERFDSVEAG